MKNYCVYLNIVPYFNHLSCQLAHYSSIFQPKTYPHIEGVTNFVDAKFKQRKSRSLRKQMRKKCGALNLCKPATIKFNNCTV